MAPYIKNENINKSGCIENVAATVKLAQIDYSVLSHAIIILASIDFHTFISSVGAGSSIGFPFRAKKS